MITKDSITSSMAVLASLTISTTYDACTLGYLASAEFEEQL